MHLSCSMFYIILWEEPNETTTLNLRDHNFHVCLRFDEVPSCLWLDLTSLPNWVLSAMIILRLTMFISCPTLALNDHCLWLCAFVAIFKALIQISFNCLVWMKLCTWWKKSNTICKLLNRRFIAGTLRYPGAVCEGLDFRGHEYNYTRAQRLEARWQSVLITAPKLFHTLVLRSRMQILYRTVALKST